MKAIVPAAGKGTRLRPLTDDRPKALVRVEGCPLLTYVFDELLEHDIGQTIVIIGYQGEQIKATFGDRYRGLELTYVTQHEQCGLAHAIFQARDFIEDTFLVLNGDNVFLNSIGSALNIRQNPAYDGAILVERAVSEAAVSGGCVAIEGNVIHRVVEKPHQPTSAFRTTGCYVLPPEIMDAEKTLERSERGEFELADAINEVIGRGGRFLPIEYTGDRINVNTPSDIVAAERALQERQKI